MYFNGEAVEIFHQPATTDGDSIVLFRRSDVVSTGISASNQIPGDRPERRTVSRASSRG